MSRHARNIPLLLALAGVCFLSWQAARPVFVTTPNLEHEPMTLSLYVQDSDGTKFWITWQAEDGESAADLLARAKAECAANGWQILDPPEAPPE